MKDVLILSKSDNLHADAVEKVLSGEASVHRIDFDRVIEEKRSVLVSSRTLISNDIDLTNVSGVFTHNIDVELPRQYESGSLDYEMAKENWRNVVYWLETTLTEAVWVNRMNAWHAYRISSQQLSLASDLTLEVPKTCFTNDHDRLKEFAKSYGGKVLLKTGNLRARPKKGEVIYAVIVDVDEIDPIVLRGSPCMFQEYVEKAFELRVHVIGDTVLTCKIESQANETTKIDWRNYNLAKTPHYPFELKEEIANKLIELTKRMGLSLGIIDMIVTPEGKHVFLENNSQGHWLWIEKLTGLPITARIADILLQ